jgi:hypothetical protein
VGGSCEYGNEPLYSIKILGIFFCVAERLAASQQGLISMEFSLFVAYVTVVHLY